MENIRIYLSGGMSGLTLENQLKWRNQIKNAIKFGDYDIFKNPIFFSPPDYYSPSTNIHKNEKEVMDFELYHLRKSDVVVANFNIPESIGTAMEIMIAKENQIPIIGIKDKECILHPWLTECCTRMCDNLREAVDYLVNFYLK